MSVSGVNNNANQASQLLNASSQNQQSNGVQQSAQNGLSPAAVYQQSGGTQANQFRPDRETMTRLTNEANQRSQQLMDLVERLFGTQARTFQTAMGELRAALEGGMEIDPDVVAQAQRDIADDGYFGVEQTSQRILDFARAISGGDPSRIAVLRQGVERGFEAAERAWGGRLPEISQRTLEAVRRGFDEWEQSARNTSNLSGNQAEGQ
ncbi:MAG: hypothetical protein FWE20_08475 [Defluviitaleaceae bacterium]|nr:hypothetical protein [Defluviitaleaceae bacterium]